MSLACTKATRSNHVTIIENPQDTIADQLPSFSYTGSYTCRFTGYDLCHGHSSMLSKFNPTIVTSTSKAFHGSQFEGTVSGQVAFSLCVALTTTSVTKTVSCFDKDNNPISELQNVENIAVKQPSTCGVQNFPLSSSDLVSVDVKLGDYYEGNYVSTVTDHGY